MKPLSPCTTPRKLMVPISRHFLPELQLEPLARLTTGLINGSRRPFAAYLLSGASDVSLPEPSSGACEAETVAATFWVAEGLSFDLSCVLFCFLSCRARTAALGATAGRIATVGTFFVSLLLLPFTATTETFAGVAAAVALAWTAAWVWLEEAGGADW